MIKIILFIFILFNFYSNSHASIKEDIISNFEKIQNISFNFKQTINEKTEEGTCTIQYPKKIYCEYDNLKKKIIVSNGKSLVIKNQSNNQYYRYSLESTPLILILDKPTLIKKMVEIEGKLVDDKYFKFSLDNNNNKINIFFDKKSLNISGWQTEDLYQNLVITFIYNIKKNNKIDEKLFVLPEVN
jgi:outer membrane lipoprotein-sorting protein|tara:strand:- start:249 stop:806 length:558 start_codon:yes stop_codon:yes gene_type:complete